MRTHPIFFLAVAVVAGGCVSPSAKHARTESTVRPLPAVDNITIQPRAGVRTSGGLGITQDSTPYSRSTPNPHHVVWVPAAIKRVWVEGEESTDKRQLRPPHWVYVVTEPGHWASEAEAQLNGRVYIDTDGRYMLPMNNGGSVEYVSQNELYKFISSDYDEVKVLKNRIKDLTLQLAESVAKASQIQAKYADVPDNYNVLVRENHELKGANAQAEQRIKQLQANIDILKATIKPEQQ